MPSSVKPYVLLAFPFALFTSPGLFFPLDESKEKPTFPDFYFHFFPILFCHSCPTQGCHWNTASGAFWSFSFGWVSVCLSSAWTFGVFFSCSFHWQTRGYGGNTVCYFFFSLDGQEITGMMMDGTAFFTGVWLAGSFFIYFLFYRSTRGLDLSRLSNIMERRRGKGRPDGGLVRPQSNLRRYPSEEVEYLTYGKVLTHGARGNRS